MNDIINEKKNSNDPFIFTITNTNRENKKILSLGYEYCKTRPNNNTIIDNSTKVYWRCISINCSGRAKSIGLKLDNFEITTGHSSKCIPSKNKSAATVIKNEIKQKSSNFNENPRNIIINMLLLI